MGISMPMCASVTHSRVSVHVINMKLLVLAACVALAAAWTPGPRDLCNDANTNGGSILLPHEKYCQLYYTCDLRGNQVELFCPGRMLFAYGTGIAVCVTEGFSTFNCPKWSCSSDTDIGRRYPDTCCSKFWECTASGLSADQLLQNKNPDVQCRASGRMQWNNDLSVVSDKLGRNVDHYFFKSAGFSANSLEGSFDNTNNAQPYIYDYYYNDNTRYAPLAISMMV